MQPQAKGQESTFINKLKSSLLPVTKLKKTSVWLGVIAFLAGIALLSVYINVNSAYAVTVGGKQVAVVESQKATKQLIDELTNSQKKKFNKEISISSDIKFTRVKASKRDFAAPGQLKNLLAGAIVFETEGTVVKINGKDKLILKNESEANKVLNIYKEKFYKQENQIEKVFFEENLELVSRQVPVNKISNLNQAVKIINQGTEEVEQYTVQDGDTLWDVADAGGMSVKQLIDANPDFNPDKLSIGQKINLTQKVPLLNVVVVTKNTVEEKVDFSVQIQQDSNLYIGQTKVTQQGTPGQKEVIYQITERNGQETDREVLSEKVLKEPLPQIVAKGNRVLVASRGSGRGGSLAWPTGGNIISAYGMRDGRMHAGVDITGNTGNPIVAAEAGRIIRAGWNGGYGQCIDISHGNGVVTRYAHLSSYAVSVGQQVSRGQLIGRVGTTGRSTGPHLHFEVIIGGQHKNPSSFL